LRRAVLTLARTHVKIALVILHADPSRGGAERYTADLAGALARRGHQAAIISTASLNPTGFTRSARYACFLDQLDLHLASNAYDVVHAMLPVRRCDVYHPHAGLAVAAAERMSGFKRLTNPRRVRFSNVEQELLRSPNPPAVLCLSQLVKRDVQQHYPNLPPEKLPTLFNAVDLERFQPGPRDDVIRRQLKLPADAVMALIVANDFARKGLAEAIQATGLVNADDPRLVLVVLGKQDVTLYRRLAERARAKVVFAGQAADPRPYYRAADFFVLPTKHDPCSLVVLESLAMGLPVISTVQNGATEVMADNLHGFVLPDPKRTIDFAAAMRQLMEPAARQRMSAACVELRPKLSYEHHLDTLEAVYAARLAAKK
jgi:UDP-glucose:(heptosyl)LPS alpha-1,3-glucosyltransferase